MRVVVTIQHAGHVHFFKHAIQELTDAGHEVHVFARDNEGSIDLLERCDLDYEVLAGSSGSLASLAATQCTYELRLLRRARRIQPDVMAAVGGVAVSHVAGLVGARNVVFSDTEHATIIRRLSFPFADEVYTPECYDLEIPCEHVRYPGYHELAYLHPDRFTPDQGVRAELDVSPDDRVAIVRFGDFGSSHDMGHSGFDDPRDVVEALAARGVRVFCSSEDELHPDLREYELSLPPERFHDLLAAADLYVGEGATTAAECAVLGTPAVYASSLQLGYLEELESAYGLVANCTGPDRHARAIEAATSLLEADPETWEDRRAALLADKHDTTDVILEAIRGEAATPASPRRAETPRRA